MSAAQLEALRRERENALTIAEYWEAMAREARAAEAEADRRCSKMRLRVEQLDRVEPRLVMHAGARLGFVKRCGRAQLVEVVEVLQQTCDAGPRDDGLEPPLMIETGDGRSLPWLGDRRGMSEGRRERVWCEGADDSP